MQKPWGILHYFPGIRRDRQFIRHRRPNALVVGPIGFHLRKEEATNYTNKNEILKKIGVYL